MTNNMVRNDPLYMVSPQITLLFDAVHVVQVFATLLAGCYSQ